MSSDFSPALSVCVECGVEYGVCLDDADRTAPSRYHELDDTDLPPKYLDNQVGIDDLSNK